MNLFFERKLSTSAVLFFAVTQNDAILWLDIIDIDLPILFCSIKIFIDPGFASGRFLSFSL